MALTGLQKFDLLKDCYKVEKLSSITIDGTTITGYFNYYFVNTKTYNKTPSRSLGGAIKNLNNYTTFLTPKLKIYFNYLAFSEYQKIMQIIQASNEHTVTFFDIEKGVERTAKMYFSTEDYPELVFGYDKLRGVKGYTIELLGTNNSLGTVSITYHLNPPSDTRLSDATNATKDFTSGSEWLVGNITSGADKYVTFTVSGSTNSIDNIELTAEGVTYTFQKWNTASDGSGVTYFNGKTYYVSDSLVLYAQWTSS